MTGSQTVLFVDRTNTCASPFALASFRHHASRCGLEMEATSVGVSRECAGEPAEARATALARLYGCDLSDHCARHIRIQDIRRFSHIFALDRESLGVVRAMRPDTIGIRLIDGLADGPTGETISDLLAGSPDDIAVAFQAIDTAMRDLATEFAVREFPPPTRIGSVIAASI